MKGMDSCPTNASTVSLLVTPLRVVRNDPVVIRVSWHTTLALSAPVVATLATGGDLRVEVELLLEEAVRDDYTYAYEGAVLNPFGAAAPAGAASVLASAAPGADCIGEPTAATSFLLE